MSTNQELVNNAPSNPLLIRKHTPTLDGVRAIAVIFILLTHTTYYYTTSFPESTFERLYLTIVMLSWGSVDLFFILSGFLITGILLRSKNKENFFLNFYARRTLRVFPLYYFLLLVTLIAGYVVPIINPSLSIFVGKVEYWEVLAYIFYLTNYLELYKSMDVFWLKHCWTLSVEEQFYIIWPLAVYYLNTRRLIAFCGFLIASAFLFRCYYAFYDPQNASWFIYYFTHTRWDTLAYGSLIAIFATNDKISQFMVKISPFVLVGSGLYMYGAGIFHILPLEAGSVVEQHYLITSRVNQLFLYTAVSLFDTSLIVFLLSTRFKIFHLLTANRFMEWIGKHSYGIYIWHWPILWGIYYSVDNPTTFWENLKIQLVAVPLCLFAGYLSLNLFEKHFINMKQYFEYKK